MRKVFDEIRMQYELVEEERLQREAQEEAMFKGVHPDARQEFTVYMESGLRVFVQHLPLQPIRVTLTC